MSRNAAWLAVIIAFSMAGCSSPPRRLNVMYTPQNSLVTTGYAVNRDESILVAQQEAQLFCERQGQYPAIIKQETVYQGQYAEDVTTIAQTAGRIAGIAGSPEGARAATVLSSDTDYKTTFEFRCQ